VGRPRRHAERTTRALLDAAERIVETEGLQALSVRRVADEAGTTTRAVYSLFGSKQGLVIALGTRAFELLGTAIAALPTTADPAADLVEAGVAVFRRFAVEHPFLVRLAVQRSLTSRELAAQFDAAAADALAGLEARIAPLAAAGLLGDRAIRDAVCQFHALCEGLAAVELRGLLPADQGERIWRDALGAIITGFAAASGPAAANSGSPR
jgi:AcrR family transcriptional regulator